MGLVDAWPALRVGRVQGVKVLISWADSGAEEWALAGSLGPTLRPLRRARGVVLLVAGLASLRSRPRSRRCQRANQVWPRCWSFHHCGEPPCSGRSASSNTSLAFTVLTARCLAGIA